MADIEKAKTKVLSIDRNSVAFKFGNYTFNITYLAYSFTTDFFVEIERGGETTRLYVTERELSRIFTALENKDKDAWVTLLILGQLSWRVARSYLEMFFFGHLELESVKDKILKSLYFSGCRRNRHDGEPIMRVMKYALQKGYVPRSNRWVKKIDTLRDKWTWQRILGGKRGQ